MENNNSFDEKFNLMLDRIEQLDIRISKIEKAIDPIYYYKKPIHESIVNLTNSLLNLTYELVNMCKDADLNFITFKKLSTYKEKFEKHLNIDV